jgi:hypothetical protein
MLFSESERSFALASGVKQQAHNMRQERLRKYLKGVVLNVVLFMFEFNPKMVDMLV